MPDVAILRLAEVDRIEFRTSPVAHRSVVAWFTSPYWHAPPRLVELLVDSVRCTADAGGAVHPRLAPGPLAAAIARVADLDGTAAPVALVDLHLAADVDHRAVAAAVRDDRDDAVVVHHRSGAVVTARLSCALAWILGRSLGHGFADEVRHGVTGVVRRFDASGSEAVVLPLAATLPLPAGVDVRCRLADRSVAVPLAAYPLTAILLPEVSPLLWPTTQPLAVTLLDSGLGDRTGDLDPLGRTALVGLRLRLALVRPVAGRVAAVVGRTAQVLARVRDRLADTTPGRRLVDAGVDLGWLWAGLRRASTHDANPWAARVTGSAIVDTDRVTVPA